MARKKWTPQAEVTEAVRKTREKRKWQIALRRYVLEGNISYDYAPYFGIDTIGFRSWIAAQFTQTMNWENFGKQWQFDHIVPVSYFNMEEDTDLFLCWNFINIRPEPLEEEAERQGKVDLLSAKRYFTGIFEETAYPVCRKMLEKLQELEGSHYQVQEPVREFLRSKKEELVHLAQFDPAEFHQLNTGTSLEDLLIQRDLLKKFG